MFKTLLTALLLSTAPITPAHAGHPEVTTMEPVSERGERKVSIEEVTNNIEDRYSDTPIVRSEEREESRRADIEEDNLDDDAKRDIACLTEAIYFESLHEPEEGQKAVANVIMNRAAWEPTGDHNKHHYEFSKSICDVVAFNVSRSFTQRKGHGRHSKMIHRRVTTCAFSYRCERGFRGKLERARQREVWSEIKTLATETYLSYNSDENVDPSKGATFYHASYVHPSWRKIYQKTTQIGAHIFYRIP